VILNPNHRNPGGACAADENSRTLHDTIGVKATPKDTDLKINHKKNRTRLHHTVVPYP